MSKWIPIVSTLTSISAVLVQLWLLVLGRRLLKSLQALKKAREQEQQHLSYFYRNSKTGRMTGVSPHDLQEPER